MEILDLLMNNTSDHSPERILTYAQKFESIIYSMARGWDGEEKRGLPIPPEESQYLAIKILIENGANITINNNFAIRIASNYGKLQIVKLLIQNGVDITADDNYSVRYTSKGGSDYLDESQDFSESEKVKLFLGIFQ